MLYCVGWLIKLLGNIVPTGHRPGHGRTVAILEEPIQWNRVVVVEYSSSQHHLNMTTTHSGTNLVNRVFLSVHSSSDANRVSTKTRNSGLRHVAVTINFLGRPAGRFACRRLLRSTERLESQLQSTLLQHYNDNIIILQY